MLHASLAAAACGGAVACDVLWASVAGAVDVVVAEVPRFAWVYQSAAPPAVDFAGFDSGHPAFTFAFVPVVVASGVSAALVWITSLSVDGSVRFEGKGLSASRVRQTHQLVGAVFRFAIKAKHLATNPSEDIDLPDLPETEQRYLTHEQLHRLALASGRQRTLMLVLGYCGLRFGEAAALRVKDVDLASNRIRVRRSVTYVRKTGIVEGPTKGKSARTVPVPGLVAALLTTEVERTPR